MTKFAYRRRGGNAALPSADLRSRNFSGAVSGKGKGLFITTAKFSQGAQAYADEKRIILVDGRRLAQLMIEYGVGVSEQKVCKIKRIDGDYFNPEQ